VKRVLIFTAAIVGLFLTLTLISNSRVKGNDNNDRNRGDRNREDEGELEVRVGFAISPIPFSSLNLKGKDPELAGLGSYIVNSQGGCNDCHTCPSYAPGPPSHNPYPPTLGDGQFNSKNYLAGGVPFGPTLKSRNITPDATGKPAGLTLEQFETAIHTGHDPLSGDILEVMPWPIYRFMTGRDLDAIYTYLSALPHAEPGDCTGAGQ
jgi:hypothetical protein